MSNQRPTDDEIRKRIKAFLAAVDYGNAMGVPDTDATLSLTMAAAEALQWVLGEKSGFDGLYKTVTDLLRSIDELQQQNYRLN